HGPDLDRAPARGGARHGGPGQRADALVGRAGAADHRHIPGVHPGAYAADRREFHRQPGRPGCAAFARGGAGFDRPGPGRPPAFSVAAARRADMRRGAYTLALYAAAPLAWLWMARRARRAGGDWGIFSPARFGRADPAEPAPFARPPVWVHAVSLGETRAAQ